MLSLEIKRRYDYIDVENIKCGIHLPFDGVVMDRKAEELKLEQHAQSKGVQFFNEFILNKIHVNNDRVSNIEVCYLIDLIKIKTPDPITNLSLAFTSDHT